MLNHKFYLIFKKRCIKIAFKNEYKINGDTTIIYLKQRNGKIFETIIDTKRLQEIINLNVSWHVRYTAKNDTYYAHATKYLGLVNGKPKYMSLHLHKVIMNIPPTKKILIDHKNHNGLDNREENLQLSNYIKNGKNRNGKNSNNISGYRNVSKQGNKWAVQLQINGKNTKLKTFPLDQLDEAGKYAEEMRKKYYGKYQGLN